VWLFPSVEPPSRVVKDDSQPMGLLGSFQDVGGLLSEDEGAIFSFLISLFLFRMGSARFPSGVTFLRPLDLVKRFSSGKVVPFLVVHSSKKTGPLPSTEFSFFLWLFKMLPPHPMF